MLQTHNQSQAMLRSVLHNVRRHMTTEQVMTFADALPPLPRGIFIEGWRPTDPQPIGSANDFLQEVMQDLSPHHVPPDSIVADVFAVLNFVGDTLTQLVIFLPFFLIMALAVWRSGVWERRVIREELAEEVGRTVSTGEYHDIVGDRILRTRRIDPARPRASAALVNAQHELAFRKRRVRDEGKAPERDHLAAGWRDEIRRLRAAL